MVHSDSVWTRKRRTRELKRAAEQPMGSRGRLGLVCSLSLPVSIQDIVFVQLLTVFQCTNVVSVVTNVAAVYRTISTCGCWTHATREASLPICANPGGICPASVRITIWGPSCCVQRVPSSAGNGRAGKAMPWRFRALRVSRLLRLPDRSRRPLGPAAIPPATRRV